MTLRGILLNVSEGWESVEILIPVDADARCEREHVLVLVVIIHVASEIGC